MTFREPRYDNIEDFYNAYDNGEFEDANIVITLDNDYVEAINVSNNEKEIEVIFYEDALPRYILKDLLELIFNDKNFSVENA